MGGTDMPLAEPVMIAVRLFEGVGTAVCVDMVSQ